MIPEHKGDSEKEMVEQNDSELLPAETDLQQLPEPISEEEKLEPNPEEIEEPAPKTEAPSNELVEITAPVDDDSNFVEEKKTPDTSTEENAKEKSNPKDVNKIPSYIMQGSDTTENNNESNVEKTPRKVNISGWTQFLALMRKNFILKCRTPMMTFFEIFCPIAMVWILTAAFEATGVTEIDAMNFSKFETEVPGVLMFYLVLTGVIPNPPDIFSGKIESESQFSVELDETDGPRKLQEGPQFSKEQELANAATNRRNLDSILASPLPIPSLNHYLQMHQIFKQGFNDTVSGDLQEFQNTVDFSAQWGNLLSLGNIHVVGDEMSNDFVDYVTAEHTNITKTVNFITWSNAEEALEHVESTSSFESTWAVIDFTNDGKGTLNEDGNDIEYTIRMNSTVVPWTRFQITANAVGYDSIHQMYYFSGYLTLQKTVNDFFLSRNDACPVPGEFDVWTAPMPTAAFSQNEFFLAVGYLLAMALAMAFLFPVSRLIKSIVEEKESRMKQTLLILGVKPWAHWLSWTIFNILFFVLISVLVTALLATQIAQNSDKLILFAFIMTFALSIMSFSFFVSSFFSRAKLASILGPLLFFGTLLPRYIFLGTRQEESIAEKMWASLAPCTAFAFGAELLAELEYAEQGFQWWNIRSGGFDVAMSFNLMFVDAVLYMVLAWYLELVVPSQFGVRKAWYFVFTPSYWKSVFGMDSNEDDVAEKTDYGHESHPENYQTVDSMLAPRVRVQNLVKVYKKGTPPAVNNLNLSLYEDQITCLLGHNGAGKSTTMSVLTGLFPPTQGDCFIYDRSIRRELGKLRQSMGICPQHNVIFEDMSVYEHIRLFETVKGVKPTPESILEKAKEVDLDEKLYSYAKTLSGGQKRKLCVAMALCGEPKFVLFDEPTSGMDPFSRRATWELLRKKKKGRVTLLTTHFMEEAELLADRIAVLSAGKLQCYGTNLFLKERFGLGYNLTVVIDRATNNPGDVLQNSNHSDVDDRVTQITSFLEKHISNVELLRKSARELIFRFPPGSETHFEALFKELESPDDTARADLGIGGYGISNTTLEEVFIRLADEQEHEREDDELQIEKEKSMRFLKKEEEETTFDHVSRLSYISILLGKRLTVQKRDKKGFVFQIVLPVIAVAIALVFLTLEFVTSQPPMELTPDLYHFARRVQQTNIVVGGNLPDIEGIASFMKETFEEEYDGLSVDLVPTISNSSEMSNYLLETYHTLDHDWRYQAYVFNDTIKLDIIQNWDDIRFILEKGDPRFIGDNGILLVDLDDPVLDRQFDFADVAAFVYSTTTLTPETEVNIASITRSLHSALAFVNNGDVHEFIDSVATNFEDVNNVADLFSSISVQTGGSAENLDATYRIIFDSVKFDFVTETMRFNSVTFTLEDMDVAFEAEEVFIAYEDGFKITLFNVKREGRLISDEMVVPIPGANELEQLLEGIFLTDLTVGDPTEYGSVYNYIASILPEESNTTATYEANPNVTVMFNTSSFHSVSAGYQGYIEYLYKSCTSNPEARFVSVNYPLPLTEQANIELKAQLSVFASLFTLIPLCYAPAAFIIYIVKERSTKSKHLQLVSGVDMLAFWIATYIWDMLMWIIFTGLTMGVLFVYGSNSAEVFVGDTESFLCTLALIFGYGLSALPFAYLLARNFDNHTTAQISVLGLFFVTGFIAVLVYVVLLSFPEFRQLGKDLRHLFRLWPAYNVGDGLINLAKHFFDKEVLGDERSVFDRDVAGINIAWLYGLSLPYFLLVVLLEYSGDGGSGGIIGRVLRFMKNTFDKVQLRYHGVTSSYLTSADELDGDVAREKEFVMEHKENLKKNASVLIVDLWKVFPPPSSILGRFLGYFQTLWKHIRKQKVEQESSKKPKKAVQGLSTQIMPGDTFGLLGVNGAGKTTTMAVLTGDTSPTSGEAYVAGYDVTGSTSGGVIEARKHIGFCPQIDPLLELMTARETLTMYGKLRGVPRAQLDQTVDDLIHALTLTPHADKTTGKYSGGNKRKLSLGIAIIGDPKVLFIDEASSGMDPVARRKMWELISMIGEKRSVILTTHSMEEAEALCSRIGIMIAGQMRALGSVQHLKSSYLDGYTIDMQCKPDSPISLVNLVIEHVINAVLPGSVLKERHGRFLRFDVGSISEGSDSSDKNKSGLGYMFGRLQAMKIDKTWKVENYSISQCSLEQVFIKLVKDEHGESHNFDSN